MKASELRAMGDPLLLAYEQATGQIVPDSEEGEIVTRDQIIEHRRTENKRRDVALTYELVQEVFMDEQGSRFPHETLLFEAVRIDVDKNKRCMRSEEAEQLIQAEVEEANKLRPTWLTIACVLDSIF